MRSIRLYKLTMKIAYIFILMNTDELKKKKVTLNKVNKKYETTTCI
jgi:hypothetical protein